jgi:hypothetical protein
MNPNDASPSPDKSTDLMSAAAAVANVNRYELKLGQTLTELRAAIGYAMTFPTGSADWWREVRGLTEARRRIQRYAGKYKLADRVPYWAANSPAAVAERQRTGEP